ncbi:hypothetical protein ACFW2E_44525, partial [Streptomyces sp. NPDC058964]
MNAASISQSHPSDAEAMTTQTPTRHRHHPAPRTDAPPRRPGLTGTRAVVKPVMTVLTIGLVFVAVFLAAFHTPRAHRLPVAVSAAARTAARCDGRRPRTAP